MKAFLIIINALAFIYLNAGPSNQLTNEYLITFVTELTRYRIIEI